MTPEQKLKLLLEEAGRGTKAKLAKALNISPVYVTRWAEESYPEYSVPRDKVTDIEKYFKLAPGTLLAKNDVSTVRTIPLIGLASCGIPQEYDLNGYEPVPVSSELYRDGMYAVRAEGDSMSPKINDGNLVYCVANEQIENGNIVHYMVNGESGIKKFKINDKGDIISLVPLNSDYDIITISADDGTAFKMSKVVGVVDTDF